MNRRLVLCLLLGLVVARPEVLAASDAEPSLRLEIGGREAEISRDGLLARPEAAEILVPDDVAYDREMRYRALPLDAVLAGFTLPPGEVLEMVATDGFAALFPVDLLAPGEGGAEAWLAVETAAAPWPPLPGKAASAVPFYLVWLRPEASGVRSEQWPYAVATIRSVPSPANRWPEIAVDPALPATDPIRAGQELFVVQCMACHTLNGAGSASMGPDLNHPANPTDYFEPEALRLLIRDPAALRSWPAMQMPAFDEEMLSERELDQILAYLAHMAGR